MNRRTTFTLTTMALMCLAVALPAGNAVAQQKQHVSFKAPAENSKYTEKTENIEVGDAPNHIVRIFEIHRTYPNNAPVINGIKLVEGWDRGAGDYYDGNGSSTQFSVYVMENGDKFFAQLVNVLQSTLGEKLTVASVGHITGGTGKFATIQGIVRASANVDFKAGFNDAQIDIEYSMGK
jgi:hypothetical protein